MKLICSILMLVLVGCANVVADQPVGEPQAETPFAAVVETEAVIAESQDAEESARWQMMQLLDLLATQEVMIEALYGELVAYQEGGGDYGYIYEVKPGQSLWLIADEIYGDPYRWITIYSMSCDFMGNPDLIYPGQILIIP